MKKFLLSVAMFAALFGAMSAAQAEPIRIVCFGGSNTFGKNLARSAAYPAQLQALLKARGRDVTTFGVAAAAPDLSLLHGFFDFTPKEAQLAAALASGQTLHEAAAANGIRYGTARTHLEHIFQKTGTRQQSHLVMLLQAARPLQAMADD